MVQHDPVAASTPAVPPAPWPRLLRALREAAGITQSGWATQLGLGRRTIMRWEQGEHVPLERDEAALLTLCAEKRLFRRYTTGPLQGLSLTAAVLQEVLATARLAQCAAPAAGLAMLVPADDPRRGPRPLPWPGPALPTGTLTFLFTDVEGSTGLWERHPRAMRQVMARHDALLTAVFEQHDGVVVRPRGEGDSLFCVFVRASDAVAAALAGQRALLAEDWSAVGPLWVRMGLHTGEANLREGDYYGSAVNRCARIRAAGHGGQVLVSQATAQLVGGLLPDGAGLLELGRHRLRDLAEPERLFQLVAPDLPAAFPSLSTLAAQPHNLPVQLTSFVGRQDEVAAVGSLLHHQRMVTLTGPGGSGKTRLALRVAATALDDFPDGVYFVDLAPLSDPALVLAAVARVLDVPERSDLSLLECLRRSLQGKRVLLVLDNIEHLLEAAADISNLVQSGAGVVLLVTSRAPLRVTGEQEYPVLPLPLPGVAGTASSLAAVAASPAVQLFVARTHAVCPDFVLTAENAAAVGAIVVHLDGLPLALELAASRVRCVPLATLLARLDHPLSLLTAGRRDAPSRQQTLRDTIAWSYRLLDPAEQTLFRRLAVFAGGWTLAAAEAVCNAAGDLDVLAGLSALTEQSLVGVLPAADAEPRYGMLETLREFARERLDEAGETASVARLHAAYFVAVAEAAAELLLSPAWAVGQQQLAAERHNLRAAHAAAVAQQDAATALRLTGAVEHWLGGHEGLTVARAWCEQALALPGAEAPTVARARTLLNLGRAHIAGSAYRQGVAALREGIDLLRTLDQRRDLGRALTAFAGVYPPTSRTAAGLLTESLALAKETSDAWGQAQALVWQANHAWQRGELAQARVAAAAGVDIAQRLTYPPVLEWAWRHRAGVAIDEADPSAGTYVARLLAAAEVWGAPRNARYGPLMIAAAHALLTEQDSEAAAMAIEGLRLADQLGLRQGPDLLLLEVLACAWTALGVFPEQAARVLGAVARERERLLEASSRLLRLTACIEQTVAVLQRRLGKAAFAAAAAAGRALSEEEAIAGALAVGGLPLPDVQTEQRPLG